MKNIKKKLFSLLTLIAIIMASSTSFAISKGVTVTRIYGQDRYITAVNVSQSLFNKSDYAVIASGENYPDGITGGILASVLKAPVLLVQQNAIPGVVQNEIQRLGVKNIILLGGDASISNAVEQQLSKYKIQRIQGRDRYETAAKCARKVREYSGYKNFIAIANGENFADGLAASGYLSNQQIPLLLVGSKSMPRSVEDYMRDFNIRRAIIIGGNESVPRKYLPTNVSKAIFEGSTSIDTSLALADRFENPKRAIIVNGNSFPDTLASGPLSAQIKGPILLTNGKTIHKNIKDYIFRSNIDSVIIIGGRETVSEDIVESIRNPEIKEIVPFDGTSGTPNWN